MVTELLGKRSLGENISQRFKVYFYCLDSEEWEGNPVFDAKKICEAEQAKEDEALNEKFGKDPDSYCAKYGVYSLMYHVSKEDRETRCSHCKIATPRNFDLCQRKKRLLAENNNSQKSEAKN